VKFINRSWVFAAACAALLMLADSPSLATGPVTPEQLPDKSFGEPAPVSKPVPAAKADEKKADLVAPAPLVLKSARQFPDTEVGRGLDQHLSILQDISDGADQRKEDSLAQLRKNAKEASQNLLDAYQKAEPADYFRRWLLSLTLAELKTDEAYSGLHQLAMTPVPPGLKDNDLEGSALANESAIRQNAVAGLAALAKAGNASAEKDLLSLAIHPTSGDDAVRIVAIKSYLAAGSDYDARVRTLKAQLPSRYYGVVTLAVAPPERVAPPPALPAQGGK
jgi:hypothetical protein